MITNLPKEEFNRADLKELYHLRWLCRQQADGSNTYPSAIITVY